jgi:flagellar basal-body rod protein FlgB
MAEVRNKELVNNVANMDTPYYKAKDINTSEFRELLGESIDARKSENPWRFNMNSGRDVTGQKSRLTFHLKNVEQIRDGHISTGYKVLERQDDTVMRHDQNNVTPEGELARLGKNAALHRTFLTLVKDNFKMIEAALRMRM